MTADALSDLRVGRSESGYVVLVERRGTMRTSLALRRFADGLIDHEDCDLVVDLSHCEYLDSTFLGCLVDLYKLIGRESPGRFRIAADEERTRSLLVSTHLPIDGVSPKLISECLSIKLEKVELHNLGRHVMECHRRLAEIGGPNQVVFQRIADELTEELFADRD